MASEFLALASRGPLKAPNEGDCSATATVAEVQLIRRHCALAARLYAAAVEDDPKARASHESTRAQARRLMDKLAPTAEERAAAEAAFAGLG